MKPPRKRYKSDADVLKAIDRAHARRQKYAQRADEYGKRADKLRDAGETHEWDDEKKEKGMSMIQLRNEQEKMWSASRYVQDKALPKLKGQLATIRTSEMFSGDGSIPK